jgi:hypothetical protein
MGTPVKAAVASLCFVTVVELHNLHVDVVAAADHHYRFFLS